jgi:hypothetical protein
MACALFPSMKSWSRHAVLRSELVASDGPIKHVEEVEVSKLDAIKRVSTMRSGSTQIGHKGRMATIFPNDFVVHRDKGVAQFRDEVLDEVSGCSFIPKQRRIRGQGFGKVEIVSA